MRKQLRIAIVGYGTGGQAAAVALSRDGHAVEVFERAAELGPVGAGFLLQPTGQWALFELGLLDDALAHAAPIARLYGETVAGRAVMDLRYADLDARCCGLGMQRGALFELLHAAWSERRVLHRGCRIVSVDADKGALVDEFGHHHAGFDLVIVADGAASTLRAQVHPAKIDQPYPWGAQWCLVAAGAWPFGNELRQRYVGARRMLGMLPVGTRPGDSQPRLSFFWSLPAAQLDRAGTDAEAWRAAVAAVWPEACARLADTAIPHGLAQARYRDTLHTRWWRGKAVLLGDAAHAMSPQLGQGVNMALLDALALRDALREEAGLPAALAHYAAVRRDHLRAYHFWSRWLTPLFQSERVWAPRLRDAAFLPLSRLPVARTQTLRILTGTRRGWFGRFPLPERFMQARAAAAAPVTMRGEAPRGDGQ